MPRLILTLESGAQPSAISAQAQQVSGVTDAQAAAQANSVIVAVDELSEQTRTELANLPNVTGVFDDIQAIPQVASDEEVKDFLQRVKELRGESNVPPTIALEPTRPGEPVTDGGVALPLPTAEAQPLPQIQGPIQSATDSLEWTGARAMHEQGIRGDSILSVVLDTGACGDAIRTDRQLQGADLTKQSDPWTLFADHGGMSTGIMAGDETTPGIETGFLPASDVYPIKSTLAASELIRAQDIIARLANNNPNKTIIVNNSWGFPECTGLCQHPITSAIQNTASMPNVIQVFAAGNNASGVTGCGQKCNGSTPGINGPNSLSSVVTVAASGHNAQPNQLHPYSSRGGPGDIACGQRKPDLSAPVFGTVPYGCRSRDMGNGPGTSGACPMVSGAIGLIVDQVQPTTPQAVTRGLRQSAKQFRQNGFNGCSGAGNIQIAAAAQEPTPEPQVRPKRATAKVAAGGLAGGLAAALLREWIGG